MAIKHPKKGDRIKIIRGFHFLNNRTYRRGSIGTVESVEQDLMTVRFDQDGKTGPVFRQEAEETP